MIPTRLEPAPRRGTAAPSLAVPYRLNKVPWKALIDLKLKRIKGLCQKISVVKSNVEKKKLQSARIQRAAFRLRNFY